MIGSLIGLIFASMLAVVALAACIFWIWMLVDAIRNKGLGDAEKIAWVLVILFLHFVGGLVYFLVGRPRAAAG